MMLSSQQLCEHLRLSERHVRRITRDANNQGLKVMAYHGKRFRFELISSRATCGKAYAYTAIDLPKAGAKPGRKVKTTTVMNPNLLPVVAELTKPSTDEKIDLIRFYNTSNYSLGLIVNALIIKHGVDIKPDSLCTKIKRWAKTFKQKGRSGLEDKRGGKEFKADLQLVRDAVLGAGSRYCRSLYLVYCQFYAQRYNLELDYINPKSDISESAFNRTVKHLCSVDEQVRGFLRYGQDSLRYARPSFHNVWEYPNQQWEVDATPLDLLVKVPVDEAGNKDFYSRDENAHFVVVNLGERDSTKARTTLVRVIDNFTTASVHIITESSNSNANARLLYKAFSMLGKPETVRSDQGSDYISRHSQGLLEGLGIDSIILPPASGDKKGTIERSFRTLQHSALFESLPGFIGHNVHQRQHLENEASTKREKKSNVATNIKGEFLWHWEAERWIEMYLKRVDAEKYAQHAHFQLTEQELNDIFRRLGKQFTRRVSKNGVRHNKKYYLDNELWAKHLTIGDKVQIHENMDDTTKLFVFKDDVYFGEALVQDIFMQSQTVEQSKATQQAYRQRVVSKTRQQMHEAQKQFRCHQNKVRDEFLDIETRNTEIKRKREKEKEKSGFDSLAEFRRYALQAVN